MSRSGEEKLVAWLASRRRTGDPDVAIDLGDDMAHVRTGAGGVLVTADMLMDGVDFDSSVHSPEQIGRKALAASLSDCAAMAVKPRWAVVSMALPKSWTVEQAKGLFMGMEPLAVKYGCRLIGGDTNSWGHPLVLDVVVLAEPYAGIEPVRRSGARPGDALVVTGLLGGSLLASADGPHHLTFEPRVFEAERLARRWSRRLHAMMDLSDGLSVDAARMAEASGCGLEMDEAMLHEAVSPSAMAASQTDGRGPLDHVLNDGEDFELLAAVEEGALAGVPADVTVITIGRAVEERGLWLRRSGGRRVAVEPRGWRHELGQ